MNHNPCQPEEEGRIGHLLPSYEDRLAGVPAILLNSAKEVVHDGVKGVIVPDPEGLQIAVAVARSTVPQRLRGGEIRALRKAMRMQARALAEYLDVTPETVSRWENGREPIGASPERLLRLHVLQRLRDKAPGVPAKASDVLDMKISHLRLATSAQTLQFEHVNVFKDGQLEAVWWFRGLADEAEEPVRQTA